MQDEFRKFLEENERFRRLYTLFFSDQFRSVFHLKVMSMIVSNASLDEKSRFEEYIAGGLWPPEPPGRKEIMRQYGELLQGGRTTARVHVIEQLTPYVQYEIDWGYRSIVPLGEQVYLMHADKYKSLVGAELVEFMLFDEKTVGRVLYENNRYADVEFIEDKEAVGRYVAIRDVLLGNAVALQDFLAALRQGTIPWPASLG